MNEFNTVVMSAVSAGELEQAEGGSIAVLGPLLAGFGLGLAIGAAINNSRGGEALPGLGVFLLGTTAIATAAGGRPQ